MSAWRPWFLFMVTPRLSNPMRVYNHRELTTPYRGELWLHSGGTWDREGARKAQIRGLYVRERTVATGYIGLATLVDVHRADHPTCQCDPAWAEQDAYHWCFADVRKLPVASPGHGRSGLFRPDPIVLEFRDELLPTDPEGGDDAGVIAP